MLYLEIDHSCSLATSVQLETESAQIFKCLRGKIEYLIDLHDRFKTSPH